MKFSFEIIDNRILPPAQSKIFRKVESMSAIARAGDYWVDYQVGVIFCYSFAGTTMPILAATTLTYYHYNAVPAVLSSFACVLSNTTDLLPGDFLACTAGSNWIRIANPSVAGATDNFASCIGQVIGFITEPKDYLEYVRTAYASLNTTATYAMSDAATGYLGQMDQMPGSANGGYSDLTHYAGGANKLVLIYIINR